MGHRGHDRAAHHGPGLAGIGDDPPVASPPRRVGPVIRRAAWGLADQAVSSATNFAVGALIARSVDAEAFGSFSLSYLAYTVFLNAGRALATTPLIVRFSGSGGEEWRRNTAAATGMAFVVGIVSGAICLAVAALTSGTLQQAFLMMGLLLPGLLVQDAWRFAFFARGTGRAAFVNDLISAIAMVPAFIVALGNPQVSPIVTLMLAWGGGTAVAAVAGCAQAGAVPSLTRVTTWWREHRDIAARFLVEFTIQSGVGQAALAVVGVVAGLAAIAAIRAAQLLLGPLNVLFMGLELVVVPEAVSVARRSTRSLVWLVRLIGISEAAVAAGLGIVLWLVPDAWGTEVLGANWAGARSVIVPLTIWLVAACLQGVGILGLRAMAAAAASLRTRLVTSSLYLVGTVGGAVLAGAVGAAWGIALSSSIGVVVWWTVLHRTVARTGPHTNTAGGPVEALPLGPD